MSWCAVAQAFQIGDIELRSAQQQPLRSNIVVTGLPLELDLATIEVIASLDNQGVNARWLSQEVNSQGEATLQLLSEQPLSNPQQSLFLTIASDTIIRTRSYDFELPTESALRKMQRRNGAATQPLADDQRQSQPVSVTSVDQASNEQPAKTIVWPKQITLQPRDTLWSVSRKLSAVHDMPAAGLMQALVEENPELLTRGVDNIQEGLRLSVPKKSVVTSIDPIAAQQWLNIMLQPDQLAERSSLAPAPSELISTEVIDDEAKEDLGSVQKKPVMQSVQGRDESNSAAPGGIESNSEVSLQSLRAQQQAQFEQLEARVANDVANELSLLPLPETNENLSFAASNSSADLDRADSMVLSEGVGADLSTLPSNAVQTITVLSDEDTSSNNSVSDLSHVWPAGWPVQWTSLWPATWPQIWLLYILLAVLLLLVMMVAWLCLRLNTAKRQPRLAGLPVLHHTVTPSVSEDRAAEHQDPSEPVEPSATEAAPPVLTAAHKPDSNMATSSSVDDAMEHEEGEQDKGGQDKRVSQAKHQSASDVTREAADSMPINADNKASTQASIKPDRQSVSQSLNTTNLNLAAVTEPSTTVDDDNLSHRNEVVSPFADDAELSEEVLEDTAASDKAVLPAALSDRPDIERNTGRPAQPASELSDHQTVNDQSIDDHELHTITYTAEDAAQEVDDAITKDTSLSDDEAIMQLDLARAYIAMQENASAREVLLEVVRTAPRNQVHAAQDLLVQIS